MSGDLTRSSLYTSHVLLISETPNLSENDALVRHLADKYTALRIAGLEQSVRSFSATFQDELRLTAEDKISRILVPNKHILVIVKRNSDSEVAEKLWYDEEWVGQATLFGPLSSEEYSSPFRNTHIRGNLSNDQIQVLAGWTDQATSTSVRTAHWHMTALYVDINHRRLGLAKKLCSAVFEHISNCSKSEGYDRALLRIIIKPSNTVVLDMYKILGFSVVEGLYSTLAEAAICASDYESLPIDYEEQQNYTRRGGIFMLKRFDLNMG